ncbi:hypothetical protein E2C01_080452 [Portunus trituberculatus]|uniref:Uncharacterized protein n=1 Tax=Portunus trituberculatus TaxID=210409 RepID=A0A5B7IU52_PORTR|nr:hypothetical protein [Portunus trituberculatus]
MSESSRDVYFSLQYTEEGVIFGSSQGKTEAK